MATQIAPPQFRPPSVDPRETQPPAEELISYADLVEKARSWSKDPRVAVSIAGTSDCGRKIFVIAVSQAENLAAHVAHKRRFERAWDSLVHFESLDKPRVGNPEAAGLRDLKPALLLHAGSFGFEASHTEAACQVIDHLLSSNEEETRTLLDHSVMLVMPMVNPDSRELAIEQWKQYRLAPGWPGAGNSYGFLMNRDFYYLSQAENQAVHKVLDEWHPMMVLDTHEDMAFLSARKDEQCWTPPFCQPRHKNLDSQITDIVDTFSAAIAERWRKEGFNVWHEPGNGSFISFLALDGRCDLHSDLHGVPCLFTESARTPGGQTWKDRNRQKVLASLTFFSKAAAEYERILSTQFEYWKQQVRKGLSQAPQAFIIPKKGEGVRDVKTTEKLIALLLAHEIQVYAVEKPYPAYVVPAGQPNRALLLTLLEVQPWNLLSLPPAMGVECLKMESLPKNERQELLSAALTRVFKPEDILSPRVQFGETTSAAVALANTESNVCLLHRAFDLGLAVQWVLAPVTAGRAQLDPGTFLIHDPAGTFQQAAHRNAVPLAPLRDLTEGPRHTLQRPRLAVYMGQGANEKNLSFSGEILWALDQMKFPWTAVTEDDLGNGALQHFHVLLVPAASPAEMLNGWDATAQNYSSPWQLPGATKGLRKKGIEQIHSFIRHGGRYIGIGSGGALACQELAGFADVSIAEQGLGQARVYLDIKTPEHPLFFGYKGFRDQDGQWHANEMPGFYYCDLLWPRMDNFSGPMFRAGAKAVALATFKRVDYEPWTQHLEQAPDAFTSGNAAIVYQALSKGSILLLGINVGFRAQWVSNYRLLSNSILSWNMRT